MLTGPFCEAAALEIIIGMKYQNSAAMLRTKMQVTLETI